jgi:hypothetical protein
MSSTIVHDGRTDAERAYDSQRDGSIYVKPEPRSPQFTAGFADGLALGGAIFTADDQMIADWIDTHLPAAADELTDDARRAVDLDFDNVIDRVADLPDHQRRVAIALWEGFLSGTAVA